MTFAKIETLSENSDRRMRQTRSRDQMRAIQAPRHQPGQRWGYLVRPNGTPERPAIGAAFTFSQTPSEHLSSHLGILLVLLLLIMAAVITPTHLTVLDPPFLKHPSPTAEPTCPLPLLTSTLTWSAESNSIFLASAFQ